MLEHLKPSYERFLRPAVALFVRLRVHPNHLTLLGVALFAVAGWLCALSHWYVSAAFVTAGALLDGWDGLLARQTGQKSDFGAVLDSTCDRVTEILWLGGIGWYYLGAAGGLTGVALCFVALAGSLMVSYVKARCEGQGIACKDGIMQRPERIILVGVCQLCGPTAMLYGMGALGILAWFTVFERLRVAMAASRLGASPPAS